MSMGTLFGFMSAFFWMLCEAVFLLRALVTVFTENDELKWYLLLGWGEQLFSFFKLLESTLKVLASNEPI